MDILVNSNLTQSQTDYYVNSKDYKGSKLYFYDNSTTQYNYVIIKYNTNDYNWYVITNGVLKGYYQNEAYNYQFDFDKYISFDNNQIMKSEDYFEIDFRFQGNSSSKMYFMLSTSTSIIDDNITAGYFTLLDDGRVVVNDITQIDLFIRDSYYNFNFWNREDGTIYNYPIQNIVEKNSYFPITIYGDYNAYVVLKDDNDDIIKRIDIGNGSSFDFSTEFIWMPKNCESIDIYEYNSNDYNETLNGVQPNLLDDSKCPTFGENQGTGTLDRQYMDDEIESYIRHTPTISNYVSLFGCEYDYFQTEDDRKALYVASFDVRAESDQTNAYITTYINTDSNDSIKITYDVKPYTWNRVCTRPFSLPITTDPNGLGYLMIKNDSTDNLGKWVDVKNIKIEKVKFDKYVNHIPKYIASNLYGFGHDEFYLEAGKTYTLRVNGDNSNATLGRSLLAELTPEPNPIPTYIDINTTEFSNTFEKSITFTAPLTSKYNINSYYWPQNDDQSGSVYLGGYYLYEGTVDPGQDITPTDYIPSCNDMKGQTNIKGFRKQTICPGHISNDYFYFDNNSVMDKLSCKANGFEVQNTEKEFVKLGNKQYNNKTTIKNQIIQNTGYQLDEKQVYSLIKSPLVYKVEPKNPLKYQNYVVNTSDVYIQNTVGWINLPLYLRLTSGKTYYFQVEYVQDSVSNTSECGLFVGNYNDPFIRLTPNASFVAPDNVSIYPYLKFVNNYAYTPLIIKNVMITEGDTAKEYQPINSQKFDIKNYTIENSTFDGYQHKLLSEKNIELILTEQEQITKRNNIKITFYE